MAQTTAGRPASMTAVVLMGHGDFDQYVHRDDVPVRELAHGEVLVAIEASSLNNTDVNVRSDWYAGEVDESGLTFPRIQGADVVGRIVETGAGVDPARSGERVICDPNLRGGGDGRPERSPAYGLLGFHADGAFAQYVAVPAVNAWSVPEHMPAAELAAYPLAYSTALEMIVRSRARPAETMIVTGASGGVGSAAVQLGKLFRLNVVAIASGSKADRLREMGADVVIDREAPSVADALREAGAGPVDVVVDVVGGQDLANLLAVVRPEARCVTAGSIGGPICPIDLRHAIYKDIEIHGQSRTRAATFAMLVDLIRAGALDAPVAATYPLRELVAAQQAFIAKQHVGKIVLTVTP